MQGLSGSVLCHYGSALLYRFCKCGIFKGSSERRSSFRLSLFNVALWFKCCSPDNFALLRTFHTVMTDERLVLYVI